MNAVDSEDALKYLPSLFVRKRNNGDTQPVLETRTWGVNSSARSLEYVDDVLISALIANNNTIGAPRWGLVAPEEIERMDFLYGPFAAAYPGNSIGGVLQITTKMPEKLEVDLKQNEGFQTFNQYGTHKTFRSDQTSGSIGDRVGDLSWFIAGSYLNSFSQPLVYVTTGSPPAGTKGTFLAQNKLGAVADVVGAGLLHSEMANAKLKLEYDITTWMKATYTFGFYSNNTTSTAQSYLTTSSGAPTYAGVAGFASDAYTYDEKHMANSLSLVSSTRGPFDIEFVISNYDFLNDVQRNPYGVTATGLNFTTNGKIAVLNGTNWTNADLKAIWRPTGYDGPHEVSFGLHGDQYNLHNPTYASTVWYGGPDSSGTLYTNSRGVTETGALWVQDAWRFAPGLKLITGGRLESWQAIDGYNLAATQTSTGAITATTSTAQPSQNAVRFSPKATLEWEPDAKWLVKGSFGEANRFPTVSELYQIVQTGSTYQVPNANLRPEQALTEELAVERHWTDGKARVSLFQEDVNSALISQTNFLTGTTPYTFFVNVDAIRNRGVEAAAEQHNVLIRGLEFSGSVTYVDSRIVSDPNFASSTSTTATGKHVPYAPDWRATILATYRPDTHWAFTVAARYSGKQYSTLDNTDVTPHVLGAFDRYVVADTRIHYAFNDVGSVDFGIDNLNNEKYFLYHPFPGRTFYADAKIRF